MKGRCRFRGFSRSSFEMSDAMRRLQDPGPMPPWSANVDCDQFNGAIAPNDMDLCDILDGFLGQNDFGLAEEEELLERLTDGSCEEGQGSSCESVDEHGARLLQVPWLSEPTLRETQGKGTTKLASAIAKAPLKPGSKQVDPCLDEEVMQTARAQGKLPRPCVGARAPLHLLPTPTQLAQHGCD